MILANQQANLIDLKSDCLWEVLMYQKAYFPRRNSLADMTLCMCSTTTVQTIVGVLTLPFLLCELCLDEHEGPLCAHVLLLWDSARMHCSLRCRLLHRISQESKAKELASNCILQCAQICRNVGGGADKILCRFFTGGQTAQTLYYEHQVVQNLQGTLSIIQLFAV